MDIKLLEKADQIAKEKKVSLGYVLEEALRTYLNEKEAKE